jgi:hypothetical protein
MKSRMPLTALLRATKRWRAGVVGDQVDVALAVFDFLVVDAMEFVGQGAQAFGQHANAV